MRECRNTTVPYSSTFSISLGDRTVNTCHYRTPAKQSLGQGFSVCDNAGKIREQSTRAATVTSISPELKECSRPAAVSSVEEVEALGKRSDVDVDGCGSSKHA